MIKIVLKISVFALFFSSCVIDYRVRKTKDLSLSKEAYKQLEGKFSFDSIKQEVVLEKFTNDTLINSNFTININAITDKMVEIQYSKNDTIFKTYKLYGQFRNGYFRVKTKLKPNWIFGPLVWGLLQNYRAIGMTKDKDLVLITYSGGTAFVLFIPVGASGGQMEGEFKRNW
ncbi:MAG: hypothetical protein KIT80_12070 [Chitinophagaceae bacterium]|nr:hypothetical protein [Chitinophagaceae bacterium]MCW5927639.1 hypothetical protein [Chitinophagaceae bacterium]